jgi:very-short-patch-repair endonuclease
MITEKEILDWWARLKAKKPEFAPVCDFAFGQLGRCESPLEIVWVVMWAYGHDGGGEMTFNGLALPWAKDPVEGRAKVDLRNQVKIGRDRVDFLITVDHPHGKQVRFAVECDGHSFHDRTPAQASRDRARDRRMLREGIVTVRYTTEDLMLRTTESFHDFWCTMKAFSRWCQPQGGDA